MPLNILSFILVLFLYLVASFNTVATPLQSDPQVIADLISRHHLTRPQASDIKTDSVEALQSSLQKLDPYSRYLSSEEFAEESKSMDAVHLGIGGLVIQSPNGEFIFVPFVGSPAYEAGIRNPVQLLKVEDLNSGKLNVPAIRKTIILRKRLQISAKDLISSRRIDTTIHAKYFQTPTVEILHYGDQKVIRLYVFSEHRTLSALRDAIKEVNSLGKPLVIDLRYALGGSLFEALDSISLVFPEQEAIAKVKGNDGKTVVFRGRNDKRSVSGPVYILIGPNTVSAAEVFARALQYYGYAVLVGKTTYGKCTSQSLFPLPKGDGLKLSVGHILDPEGKDCAGRGLDPDIIQLGNLHDTEALLRLIEQHNQNHRLICRAKIYPNIQSLKEEARGLGWTKNNNKIISSVVAKNAFKLCLAPAQQTRAAEAIQIAETRRTHVDLELLPLFKTGQQGMSQQDIFLKQYPIELVSNKRVAYKSLRNNKNSVRGGLDSAVNKPIPVKPSQFEPITVAKKNTMFAWVHLQVLPFISK